MSKVTSRPNYDIELLHPLSHIPSKYILPTTYGFRGIARIKFFKVKVITPRSKVKSRSNYDVAQLHLLTNVPIKYQLLNIGMLTKTINPDIWVTCSTTGLIQFGALGKSPSTVAMVVKLG